MKSEFSKGLALAWQLFCRDFKAQYRQSLLGYVWAFVPMLATTLTWVFLSSQNLVNVGETEIPYPVHVLIGSMLWNLFSKSMLGSMEGFQSGRDVFVKIKCPPEAFVAGGVTHVIFDTLLQCLLLVPAFFLFDLRPPSEIMFVPLGMFSLSLLGVSMGYILIPFASLYGDVARLVAFALSFLMYLTPVVYPTPTEGLAGQIVELNPVAHILDTTRTWLTVGSADSILPFLSISIGSIFLLVGGVVFVRISLPHLISRMGA